jgi:hypothetical protein
MCRDGVGDMAISHRIDPELRYIHTRWVIRVMTETQMHAQGGWQILKQWAHGARSWRALGLLAAGTLALGGCSSGGSVDLGNSQIGDPATVDFPIFYVKRPVPLEADGITLTQDDLRIQRDAVPGADLYMRASASPSATETNITARITTGAIWDVKDVDTSPDGKAVVFAMRGPLAMKQDVK